MIHPVKKNTIPKKLKRKLKKYTAYAKDLEYTPKYTPVSKKLTARSGSYSESRLGIHR